MKPVDQAIVHQRNGDCWSACIASILELPLEAVPKFCWHFGGYSDRACALFLEQYGYSYLRLHRYIKSEDEQYFWCSAGFNVWFADDTYCVLSGRSPNIPGGFHAVVGHIGHGGEIKVVHDPSPSKKGILGAPFYLNLFVAKQPHQLKKPRLPDEIHLSYFN